MARPPAVARVLERVTALARRFGMFEPGQTVLVACSGGPDSVCLLHALHRLRRLFRIRLEVFHFDHRLRPESPRDAAYVRRQAASLRLPFVLREAADEPARGQSLEAWARLARYAALSQAAADRVADLVALGHTVGDQAETVLLGLVRGGGIEATAGMSPVAVIPPLGVRAVRPLLETAREEVEAFNRSLRLRPRRDPMNEDRRFLRSRVRLDVLPLLEKRLDRNLTATLARTAENVRADAAYLEGLAAEAARRVATIEGDEVRLAAAELAALPAPVGARVVRQALRLVGAMGGGWETDVGSAHIRAVLDLASGRPGRRVDLPGGLLAIRAKEYVRLARSSLGPRSPRSQRVTRLPRHGRGSGRREGRRG
jgi:tRNA(Ile)-lysidine synthetase-like protein